MPFVRDDLTFAQDKAGVELEGGRTVEVALRYDDLGFDPERAPEQLGAVLSELLGETVADEEGLFDLVVHEDGAPVATLALACEDDTLEVIGERAASLPQARLVSALRAALPKA